MEKFDDLFNKYFGKKEPENQSNENNLNSQEEKINSMVDRFKEINPKGDIYGDEVDKLDEQLDKELGEPDKIEHTSDGLVYFEKRMWFQPHGIIIKTLISDVPFVEVEQDTNSLEDDLEDAIKNEDYELAANLRDKIKKRKAKEKRLQNKLKKESENIKNTPK